MYRFFLIEDMYRFSREEFCWEMHVLAVGGAAWHSLYNGGLKDLREVNLLLTHSHCPFHSTLKF
jgi:hypothetical protein